MNENRQEKQCIYCGKKFITYENYDTCDLLCRQLYDKHGPFVDDRYTKTCSMCGSEFKTRYPNKNLCSFECKQEHVRERSRAQARRKRHKPRIYEPCILCGFDLATDHHKELGKTYILCPNHHALITRGIKTLQELKDEYNIK